MKPARFLYLAVFTLLMLLLSCCAADRRNINDADGSERSISVHESSFVSRDDFYYYLGLKKTLSREKIPVPVTLASGVIPHHLAAGHLNARYFEAIVENDPKIIVLVGPNHTNTGSRIISGSNSWSTPIGSLSAEKRAISVMAQKGLVKIDERVLAKEHSIGAVIPFIKFYLPNAQVLPLIFHHDVKLSEIENLLDHLDAELGKEGYLLLASVDFSHYLTYDKAAAKDEQTIRAIFDYDYFALYAMGNDHLDSPAALSMAMRRAERVNNKEVIIIDHTNSGMITQKEQMETTSYFTLMFAFGS